MNLSRGSAGTNADHVSLSSISIVKEPDKPPKGESRIPTRHPVVSRQIINPRYHPETFPSILRENREGKSPCRPKAAPPSSMDVLISPPLPTCQHQQSEKVHGRLRMPAHPAAKRDSRRKSLHLPVDNGDEPSCCRALFGACRARARHSGAVKTKTRKDLRSLRACRQRPSEASLEPVRTWSCCRRRSARQRTAPRP